ncbi:MAG: hypothetical protein AMXMBFR13_04100 [Phycisphaerae bacterium]
MSRCLSDSEICRYHAGQMDRTQADLTAHHLATCPACSARDAALSDQHENFLHWLGLFGPTHQLEPGPSSLDEPPHLPSPPWPKPVSWSAPPIAIGGYDLEQEIHRGAQGVVYRGTHLQSGRTVAIKILKEGPFAGPRDRARFEREVQILSQLNHPNIVAITDRGMTPEHFFYFVMDFIPGESLRTCLAITRPAEASPATRPAARDVLRLFMRICEAVNAAHLRGIIHRDLKPNNILVDADGEPHILDFGLAKPEKLPGNGGSDPGVPQVTHTGQFVGTLPWASPEQVRGVSGGPDVRTDVYSIGVMLYQALAGRFPYPVEGALHEVVGHILSTEPARPSRSPGALPGLGMEVDTIVLKCLAKQPERRYQNAGEAADDIRRYLAGEAIEARRDSSLYLARKALARHKLLALLGASGLLIILLFGLIMAVFSARVAKERDRALAAMHVAEQERLRADQEADRLNRTLYRYRIGQAQRELERNRTDLMKRNLMDCPAELRSWEWNLLAQMSDQSVKALPRFNPFTNVVYPFGELPLLNLVPPVDVSFYDTKLESEMTARRLSDFQHPVTALATSRDVRRFAFATSDRKLGLGEVATGQWHTLKLERITRNIVFSWDGRRIACHEKSPDECITIRDAATGQCENKLPWPLVGSMSLSPDGKHLAFAEKGLPAGMAGTVRLWSFADGGTGEVRELEPEGANAAVAFFPDGRLLLTGHWDGSMRLTEVSSDTTVRILHGHVGPVTNVVVSPDGRQIASGGSDQTVRLWDAQTGQLLRTFRGHEAAVTSVQFVPNTPMLASTGFDWRLRFWDPRETNPAAVHCPNEDGTAVFSPDGRRIVSASFDGPLRIWDPARLEQPLRTIPAQPHAKGAVFSPDGTQMASAGQLPVLTLWDTRTWKIARHCFGHWREITAAAYFPDGRRLVTGGGDKTCRIWDAVTGRQILRLRHEDEVADLAVSPDGQRIAAGGWNEKGRGRIHLWDAATGRLEHVLAGHLGATDALLFSPDNRRLFSGGRDQTLRVWEVASGELLQERPTDGEVMYQMVFTPDGRRIVTAGMRLIEFWTADTLEQVYALAAHDGAVRSLMFSPDGRSLLSAGGDGWIRLWRDR